MFLGGHPKCTRDGHFKMYQGSVATSKCTRVGGHFKMYQ
jgi:hypothetical protein